MTEHFRLTPPAVALILVNTIPIFGVMFWGWSLLEVVALYWFENLIIGAINVLKMITCVPDLEFLNMDESGKPMNVAATSRPPRISADRGEPSLDSDRKRLGEETKLALSHHLAKLFFVPFFSFHYGFFCFVHGVFVFALLGNRDALGGIGGPFNGLQTAAIDLLKGGTGAAAIALAASHLFSYCYYFLFQGEYRRTNIAQLMVAPYGRIVVLHLAILFGAFATQFLGQPLILLLLLIAGKTILDLALHFRSHQESSEPWTSYTHKWLKS